ncbi:MAG: DUF4331 domain-containing protein [Cyanomargarita calcarea GSE-NOS-MK-12-04C]|jgi:hypothetical protein|uniref:DUF4331 domain-containing protein n=1 Tax=Cyanomargarita calcarea GSE-NOS-MK-12-04C TaxID=2839659 RepID=A0A951UVM2_9CYAN|nr:DUF4331 domain-containing protein [Cyanomargarita calcarea GSE-NOS-MK-12-04C]
MRINAQSNTSILPTERSLPIDKPVQNMAFFPIKRSLYLTGATRFFRAIVAFFAILLVVLMGATPEAKASDHQDTTFLATKLTAADLTDLFVFESPADPSYAVLVMDFDPLIVSGEIRPFDPNILYQFKIDNTGDNIEDVVLQFKVDGTGRSQNVKVYGPGSPSKVGTESSLIAQSGRGFLNQTFTTANNMKVFVGKRKDPFFFDLEQFFKIIPDRNYIVQPNPSPPFTVLSFRPAGEAKDTLDPFNVHSIIVELPRKLLGTGKIGVWMTTSTTTPKLTDGSFAQIERLAVPALNELFMDFKDHNGSNIQTPTQDASNQSQFIQAFVSATGRPKGIADAVISVAIPDVIQADLSKPSGSYFGTQLGNNFGGRRPKDDVIDVTASVVFGSAVTGITQGQILPLTSDNVGPKDSNFLPDFPYLGSPR